MKKQNRIPCGILSADGAFLMEINSLAKGNRDELCLTAVSRKALNFTGCIL